MVPKFYITGSDTIKKNDKVLGLGRHTLLCTLSATGSIRPEKGLFMEYQKEIQRPYFNFQDNRKSKKRMFQFSYFQQEDILTPQFPPPLGPGPSPPPESRGPPANV